MVDSGRIGGCGNTCVLYLDTVVTMGKRDIGRGEDYDCRFDRDKGTDFDHDGERTWCIISRNIRSEESKRGIPCKGIGKKEEADVDTSEPIRYNRVVIPAGFTYKVRLADGSVVTLNAGSELKFPEEFRDSLREVEFTGEAYFEVEKSDKPFIVKAGDSRVQVYGTRFNLFYSEKLALAEAVLVEGSIGMTANGKETKIIPHQRVWYSMKDSLMRTENVDPADYLTWLGNSFKYNRTRLDKIVFDIAQWYGVEIKIAPGLEKQAYSLEFDRSATIDWVVRALGLIIDKPIKTEGGAYYIE